MRVRLARRVGKTSSRSDALRIAELPGDLATVDRGGLRALVINCPDGCGEKLTINLDPATGKAWRLYDEDDGLTLYPSVWRSSGCKSHFILWSDRFYWSDRFDVKPPPSRVSTMKSRVLLSLGVSEFVSVEELARKLNESPWLVHLVCKELSRQNKIVEIEQDFVAMFKLAT